METKNMKNLYCVDSNRLEIHSQNGDSSESFKYPYHPITNDKIEKAIYGKQNKNLPDYILMEKKGEEYFEYITQTKIDCYDIFETIGIHESPLFTTKEPSNEESKLKEAICSYENIDLNKFIKYLTCFANKGIYSLKKHNQKLESDLNEKNKKLESYDKTLTKILDFKKNVKKDK